LRKSRGHLAGLVAAGSTILLELQWDTIGLVMRLTYILIQAKGGLLD
jgi:hypothetical protein